MGLTGNIGAPGKCVGSMHGGRGYSASLASWKFPDPDMKAASQKLFAYDFLIHPNVYGAYGISTGTFDAQADPAAMWALTGAYAPTVPECLVALGVVSVGVLIFMVLSNKLVAKSGEPAREVAE